MSRSGREPLFDSNPLFADIARGSSQPPPERLGDTMPLGLSRRGWLPVPVPGCLAVGSRFAATGALP
jgi:hypothetical protein